MEIVIICIVLLAVLFLLYGYLLNFSLKTEYYEIVSAKVREDTTIVLLTDLHACQHGRGNIRLIREIERISPGFICVAGDMTVKNASHTHRVLSFFTKLSEKYPVYYAPGNHEIRMPGYEMYRQRIKEMGVHYLENETYMAEHGIAVTGLDLPEYWYHKCWQKREFSESILTGLLGDCPGREYHILLAHNPEYFPFYASWGADLTLSGHIHGGIARLPVAGGVIAPSLRLFPRYDAGLFDQEGRKMVISRGLGLHHIKLRFFNRPEISEIHIRNKL